MSKRQYTHRTVEIDGVLYRTCSICEEQLELTKHYYKDKGRSTYYKYKCKKCERLAQKGVGSAHRYGLTRKRYTEKLNKQDNRCAICRLPETLSRANERKHLALDHCHETLNLRGFLCQNCNQGISKFQDDPQLLRQAAVYLERYNSLNQKNRVKSIIITYEDGLTETFENINALYHKSTNWRKDFTGKIVEEWIEHTIVWNKEPAIYEHVEISPPPSPVEEVVERKRPSRYEAWCSQHQMPPHDCFPQHVPTSAFSSRHPQWDDTEAIARKELPAIYKKQTVKLDFGLDGWIIGGENGLRS